MPVAVLLLATLLSAAPPARPAAAEDPVTRKKVQAYLDLAADLFRAKDFEGALIELGRAQALSDLAMVRYNVARCYEELGKDLETVAAFEKYLALQDGSPGAADRQKRAREALARIAPRLFGGLEVTCPVAESSVFILELMQAPQPCPYKNDKIPAGTYEVQTFSPGSAPFVVKVTVPPGKSVIVAAQAVPVAPPPEPEKPADKAAKPSAKPVTEDGYNVSVF